MADLPVDEVTVAGAVTAGLAEGGPAAVVARATVELARRLGLTMVAEGVADMAVLDLLVELGCHQAQGDLIAHPGPPAEVEAIVRSFAAIPPSPAASDGALVEGGGAGGPISVEAAT